MKLLFKDFESVYEDKNELMQVFADYLVAQKMVGPQFIKGLIEREKISPLYMGNYLALPHSVHLKYDQQIFANCLLVARFQKLQRWDATSSIHFAITIATKSEEHLRFLSQIALLFIDEANVFSFLKLSPAAFIKKISEGIK